MKRIILSAGGDTPALNSTIHGAVVRANQLKVEIFGLIKGFNCLFNPRVLRCSTRQPNAGLLASCFGATHWQRSNSSEGCVSAR
jgi:6-phosphofructokinase